MAGFMKHRIFKHLGEVSEQRNIDEITDFMEIADQLGEKLPRWPARSIGNFVKNSIRAKKVNQNVTLVWRP